MFNNLTAQAQANLLYDPILQAHREEIASLNARLRQMKDYTIKIVDLLTSIDKKSGLDSSSDAADIKRYIEGL